MKTTKKLSHLVWKLNNAFRNKQQSFITQSFRGVKDILDDFYIRGWIIGYRQYERESCLEIYLKYSVKGRPVLQSVQNATKPSLVPSIRLKQLQADARESSVTGILRTGSFGFTDLKHACTHKTGGIYLAKVF